MTALPFSYSRPRAAECRRGTSPTSIATSAACGDGSAPAPPLAGRPTGPGTTFAWPSTNPAAMTDLPAARRDRLVAALLPELATPLRHVCCDGGTTRKTLWRAADGTLTESVLMRYSDRATVCISSQAGCGMACPFWRYPAGRADPQPVHRGDRRSGTRRRSGDARR